MSLLATLTIDANERVFTTVKNHRTGQDNRVTFIAYGDFGGGTITVDLSADSGTTKVTNISAAGAITATDDFSRNVDCDSDSQNPVQLGFTMAGATSPSVTIKIYDNK